MENFVVLENEYVSQNYENFMRIGGGYNYFVVVDVKRNAGTTNSSI